MDAGASDDWTDLADSLSGHFVDVWLRVRSDHSEESALEGGSSLLYQPGGESGFYSDPVRAEVPYFVWVSLATILQLCITWWN